MATSLSDETGWPMPVIRAVCLVPVLVAVGVAVQRRDPSATAVAAVAALPWVLLAFEVCVVPWWATIAVTLAATATLMVRAPAVADVAPFFLVFVVAILAAVQPIRRSVVVLLMSVAVMVTVQAAGQYDGSAIWALGIVMGWLGGYSVRLQESAHAADADRAASEERQRISRELHDVVAHSLAVTMLHVTGARLSLRRDPAAAEAALVQAEESGRQSMDDIRRAIGLVGPSGQAPMPGASDLTELVAGFVSAGLPATLHVVGDLSSVPPATGLALYRIAQESMSNVAKHAPSAAASVDVCVEDATVRLSVRNRVTEPWAHADAGADAGPRTTNGLGLAGMGERASLVGGAVHAGPDEGGWCVVAEFPMATST